VSGGSFSQIEGFGLRGAKSAQVAFAHSADLSPLALKQAAQTVGGLLLRGDSAPYGHDITPTAPRTDHGLYGAADTGDAPQQAEWLAILHRIDTMAHAADPRVTRVDATLSFTDTVVMVLDLDGHLAADVRPMLSLSLRILLESNGRKAQGVTHLGRRHGPQDLDESTLRDTITRAIRVAGRNLEAVPSPVGSLPVVLAPGYPGVLFHEAVGHGLEGDQHRKNLSVFTGRIGERIAAPGVTVMDHGALPDRVGSTGVDDEGTPGQRTVLIEDGILTGLLQDRLNAGLMNARSTGNGRRQSYAHLPMPRMTNTFLENGECDPGEIIASVDHGLYIPGIGGGQVDIVSGNFNFSTTEAYLIEKGRITAPIEGATLTGAGHEALKHIAMIGNDLALDEGQAVCTKAGQSLSVGVGQPTLRINDMLVGGERRADAVRVPQCASELVRHGLAQQRQLASLLSGDKQAVSRNQQAIGLVRLPHPARQGWQSMALQPVGVGGQAGVLRQGQRRPHVRAIQHMAPRLCQHRVRTTTRNRGKMPLAPALQATQPRLDPALRPVLSAPWALPQGQVDRIIRSQKGHRPHL
jgi:TldD protein